ncbi:MAG: PDZ domain-containing protein [Planctomycetota bacterium]
MRSRLCWLTAVFAFCALAPECQGQGLIQRLRDRIRGAAQATPNALPARPIPSPTDGAAAGPTSNYRSRVVPIPAEVDGNRASGRDVRQAGAEQELDEARLQSGFGASILARPPLTSVAQPSIGIQGVNANPGYPGVEVRRFDPISKADEAGLQTGDFIFAVDGIATPNTKVLVDQVSKYKPGETIRLRIGRDGQVSDIVVPLVARQTSKAPPTEALSPAPRTVQPVVTQELRQLGVEFEDLAGSRGARVVAIESGSAAANSGLQVDDRIVAIDNRLVTGSRALMSQLSRLQNDAAELRVVRGQQLLQVELSLRGTNGPDSIENQNESGTPTLAAPRPESAPSGSMFGGLGAALGGVFGAEKPTEPASADDKDALALPDPVDQSKQADDSVRDEIAALKERLKELESKLEPKSF